MKPDEFQAYSYSVMPGNFLVNGMLPSQYNEAYKHWRNVWFRVLERLNGKGSFRSDDLMKYDQISTIFCNGEVVAQICSRTLDLDFVITRDVPYFSDFLGEGEKILKDHGVKKIMTLEYNALNSKYSVRKSNFPFTEAVLYLCYRLAASIGVGCCTAVPRKITKVQDMLEAMNFVKIKQDEMRFNCPVDIMLGFVDELKKPEGLLGDFVEQLWNERVDFNHNLFTNQVNQNIKIKKEIGGVNSDKASL